MCGSPTQTVELPEGIDTTNASIIQGTVFSDNGPVAGAFVRLLDGGGEFTAEVVASDEGYYRFFAAPGDWTVRVLSRVGNGSETVTSQIGIHQVDVQV
jgi:L-fucose isomerase-like protein